MPFYEIGSHCRKVFVMQEKNAQFFFKAIPLQTADVPPAAEQASPTMEPFALKTGTLSEEDIRLQEVAARGRFVKKLAGEFRTGFIPCQELFDHALWRAPMKHWLHDGVHPTPAGHQLLADAWLEAAKPLLP